MIDTTDMGIMANYIQPSSNSMASHMISQKDNDSDSSLSIDEIGVSNNIFSAIDSDSNGLASKTELSTAIDSAMSQFNGEMPSKEEFQSMLSDFGFEVPSSSSTNSSFSSSQLSTISSVLENYDPDNLSKSDAQEIVEAFKEAGIEPSSELESAMSEAGFDAKEVGTLANVQGQGAPSGGGGGGQGGGGDSSEEEYDEMDTNEDGIVSLEEIEEYYGLDKSESSSSEESDTNQQSTLDNLQLLMDTLKSNNEDDNIDPSSFNGLLKTINNQNNNSEINIYLQNNSNSSSLYGYA